MDTTKLKMHFSTVLFAIWAAECLATTIPRGANTSTPQGPVSDPCTFCGKAGNFGGVVNIGSSDAEERTWPWQVLISLYNNRSGPPGSVRALGKQLLCGGVLINKDWVLSTAHIISGLFEGKKPQYILTLGLDRRSTDRLNHRLTGQVQMFVSDTVILHPLFGSTPRGRRYVDYNIALIKIGHQLKENRCTGRLERQPTVGGLVFTSYVAPVLLPCMGYPAMTNFVKDRGLLEGDETPDEICQIEIEAVKGFGNSAMVTGFGHREALGVYHARDRVVSETLKHIPVEVLDDEQCEYFNDNYIPWSDDIYRPVYTRRMTCTTSIKQDPPVICVIDTGGPLVREISYPTPNNCTENRWVLMGLVSWGFGCGQTVRVNGEDVLIPVYHTDVFAFTSWIKSTITNN